MGHEAQFPPPEPSARYRFGQATFAGRVATSETLWKLSPRPAALFRSPTASSVGSTSIRTRSPP